MRRLLVLAALLVALPAGAVNIEYVAVREADNPPDTASNCFASNCGSVPYDYAISKYEVTNDQYAEFLNAVAGDDTNELYSTSMNSDARGGITQSGVSGSYTYVVKSGQGNSPVVYVNWFDAVRFTNWLHNGQPTGMQLAGTTEDGAYTFAGPTTVGARNSGALTFLPTENEWYKAAYYDATSASFFDYPTGSNTAPSSDVPAGGSNSANFYDGTDGTFALTGSGGYNEAFNYLTDVGAYTGSDSPYGTFDQGGNVWEWNETASGSYRGIRGGSWNLFASSLAASDPNNLGPPTIEDNLVGFRVARLAPEPTQVLLVLTGGLVLAGVRRQRRA
jgi:formylglycine-generating enzyme required for sulfatase activity